MVTCLSDKIRIPLESSHQAQALRLSKALTVTLLQIILCLLKGTTMATAATARGVARSSPAYFQTAGRAVHVRIHPQPLDISESREVLRVLQQYGEVIMFKNLKVCLGNMRLSDPID